MLLRNNQTGEMKEAEPGDKIKLSDRLYVVGKAGEVRTVRAAKSKSKAKERRLKRRAIAFQAAHKQKREA